MKIKRITAVISALCIMLAGENLLLPSAYCLDKDDLQNITIPSIDWDAVNEKSYEFTLRSDGTYEISKYIYETTSSGILPGGDITLPSSYKGKPVTAIGDSAFCTSNAKHITGSITIPSSVTSIGAWAFYTCNFTVCDIPDTVTSIGRRAFDDTPWLENMKKQNPMVIVNNILIDATTVKGDVVIPDGVKDISGYAFYKNTDVTSVELPESVESVGISAFEGCEALTKVNIPQNVTEIGDSAFALCENLSGTVTVPASVKTIGDFAFRYCQKMTEVVIENGVTSIGSGAFNETRSLKNVIIPASVESMGTRCFQTPFSPASVTILNPDCEIYDDYDTICSWSTIYGYTDSTAHVYAEKYDRTFIALDQSINLGDVNIDEKVDAVDATAILMAYSRISTGQTSGLNELQFKSADINKDGVINSVDSSSVLAYYSYVSTGGDKSIEDFFGI
ncbi:MAG: leucine-rich repeat protein [Ruminococcus flavefaciens]|nr:leucine-rich repeat protein [Ruminococcus flavefaciens]